MSKRGNKIDPSILDPSADASIDGLLGEQGPPIRDFITPRVVAVPLSQILPDRFHARQILPYNLKKSFYLGELDCYQAAAEFSDQAKNNPLLRIEIESLQALGASMKIHGQINPATGYWQRTSQVSDYFLLETGARRYWAQALLRVKTDVDEEPLLEVSELLANQEFRQISENIHREGLSPVELGITIASIILQEEHVFHHHGLDNEFDYFRESLKRKKIPKDIWDKLKAIFNLSLEEIKNLLQLLKLPNEFLHLAALYRMPESLLKNIIILPRNQQENAFLSAIKELEMKNDVEMSSESAETEPEALYNTPVYVEVLVNYIEDWFELANQEYASGDYLEIAEGLSARFKDASDFELLARRLTNLSRDIRVARTRRRQY